MTTEQIIATHFESAARELQRDHARLDELLDDVRSMIGDGELERAEYVFRELYDGLVRHIRAEDTILFPQLEKHPLLQAPAMVMRGEHRRIVALLGALKDALEHERGREAQAQADQLAGVLAAHNQKEERVLYPRADRLIDAGCRAEIVDELRRR
jgi:hemerythrin-like domain-containing protein